jgi:hypothetical protein
VHIPFNIKVSGKSYKGVLTPDTLLMPSGVPTSFICFFKSISATRISYLDCTWKMNAPDEFVKALGEWIEAYYE